MWEISQNHSKEDRERRNWRRKKMSGAQTGSFVAKWKAQKRGNALEDCRVEEQERQLAFLLWRQASQVERHKDSQWPRIVVQGKKKREEGRSQIIWTIIWWSIKTPYPWLRRTCFNWTLGENWEMVLVENEFFADTIAGCWCGVIVSATTTGKVRRTCFIWNAGDTWDCNGDKWSSVDVELQALTWSRCLRHRNKDCTVNRRFCASERCP